MEDPRVARSRAAILAATAALLIEEGAGGVTIEGIAARSGVAKTTIYRHWKTRSQLVFDGFESMLLSHPAPPPEGPVAERLTIILNGLVRGLTTSEWAPAVTALIDAGDRDPEIRSLLHDFLARRMAPGREVLQEAIERGEITPALDIDLAVSALVGPIFYRRLVSREEMDATFAAHVVAQFLSGARKADGAPHPH
ncbi:MAG TPA: TetR/AcrR family transcriptional regulator [Tepidiformaceae bacterium]|nr:TetR/AcrR family transcriptional regulator [Tepidiformaceae bacterium]HMO95064.1 TetR/AcrR family transcriptional regulator [Tepidiformaceae bacterium]